MDAGGVEAVAAWRGCPLTVATAMAARRPGAGVAVGRKESAAIASNVAAMS
jgi:hypothetical protein